MLVRDRSNFVQKIIGALDVFGAFRGVLKLESNFGVPWSILGGIDQRGPPWRSVVILETHLV